MSERQQARFRVRRQGNGYAVMGRGFYVWDEDRSAAIRAGMQLSSGHVGGAQATRLLYYRDDAAPTSASSEALDA